MPFRIRQTKININAICLVLLVMCMSACSGGGSDTSQAVLVQISGKVRYEDKLYDKYGFTGTTNYKSIRHVTVDLVSSDDTVVASTVTDESGYYELSGWGKNPRVRVLAQTDSSIGTVVSIRNFSGNIYAVSKQLDNPADSNFNLDVSQSSTLAGAFNMLDVFTNATQFIEQYNRKPMPDLNAYWENYNNSHGTYFCSGKLGTNSCLQGRGIYVLGGSIGGGDSDQNDDDVLYHEFAHYMENVVGAGDSPGGTHYLTENDQDLRLTWSEGLGGFFPAAIKTWLEKNHSELLSTDKTLSPTYFVDTYGSYVGISMDFSKPNSVFCPYYSDCYVYSSNEVAVAKILVGLMNSYGMNAVWNVYARYMATDTRLPASLETFWDGWVAQRSPSASELNDVSAIFNERMVNYNTDRFESDNDMTSYHSLSVCTGSSCSGETHSLYYNTSDGDKDIVSFYAGSGNNYLVETFDLSNGADTYIRILDRFGNVATNRYGEVMENDNRPGTVYCGSFDTICRVHNDDIMLSSELNFSPITSGTYFVEVTTSKTRPNAAGRYGSYTLMISR